MSDMSLTPVSSSRSQPKEPLPMPTVELSFSSGPNGAWDDRELINAANSAMKEFHTHHPGPGSWLDQATAAMALGRPLPGANDYGSAWYTASVPPVQSESADLPAKKKRKTKKTLKTADPYDTINPYSPSAPAAAAVVNGEGRPSPTYHPPSPGAPEEDEEIDEAEADAEWGDVEVAYDEEEEEWEEEDYPLEEQQQAQSGPAQGQEYVRDAAGMSREEALDRAMKAQYWAGYWMGVAQSKGDRGGGKSQVERRTGKNPEGDRVVPEKLNRPKNVFVTKASYSNGITGLKR